MKIQRYKRGQEFKKELENPYPLKKKQVKTGANIKYVKNVLKTLNTQMLKSLKRVENKKLQMLNVLNMLKTCLKIVENLNNAFSKHKSKHFTVSSDSFLDKLIHWRDMKFRHGLNFTDLKQGFLTSCFFLL